MAQVIRSKGTYPAHNNAIINQVGPAWHRFGEIFPVFFYSYCADLVVQVQVVGNTYENAVIHVITPLTENDAEVDQALVEEGTLQLLFELGTTDGAKFLIDLKRLTVLNHKSFFYNTPPLGDGSYLMLSTVDGKFYIISNSLAKATVAAANYRASELLNHTEEATPLGKELLLALCAQHFNIKVTSGEVTALDKVYFPAGTNIPGAKFSDKTLAFLTKAKSKTSKKLKQPATKEPKVSLVNLVLANNGIPAGLVGFSIKNPTISTAIVVDTLQEYFQSIYLKNGFLYITLVDKNEKLAYATASQVFKGIAMKFE